MYFFWGSGSHGQETSFCPGCQGRPDRMHARNEAALGAQLGQNLPAHAGHDAHVHDHIGGIGDFHADFAERGSQRAHGEGDDVHRAAPHAALEPFVHRFFHLERIRPMVGRARLLPGFAANKRPVFHAGHVAGMRAREVRAGAFPGVEFDEACRSAPSNRTARGFPRSSRRTNGCSRAGTSRPFLRPTQSACDWWSAVCLACCWSYRMASAETKIGARKLP